ncbi:hypothetical protein HZA86_05055 [Candidatus Uhrbacteria bacterium]|nr:hypothetical protein [Candidatus Uhrbacteria bacterium]
MHPDRTIPGITHTADSPITEHASMEADRTKQNTERAAQELQERLEQIKREVLLLLKQKEEASTSASQERGKLLDLWRKKLISSKDEFKLLSDKLSELENSIDNQIVRKKTEYRLTRMEYLSETTPPDAIRQRVLDLHIEDNIEQFTNLSIQAGGSNAQGVFEIENGDFVLIKKVPESYEYNVALPFIMQGIQSDRIPRVLQIFKTDDATYTVTERARGTQVDQLSEEQIAEIPQEHFNQFLRDLAMLGEKGLQIDPSKKSNFFYDAQKGFSIIDIGDHHNAPTQTGIPNNLRVNDLQAILTGPKQDQRIIDKIQEALTQINRPL